MLVNYQLNMLKMITMNRTYSELKRFNTFADRYEYLKLTSDVGAPTFGFDRFINQRFYKSRQWENIRDAVIYRDNGCDLGIEGYEIYGDILIHHMNPMGVEDILHGEEWIIDPEYLITTTKRTHNAIHFGIEKAFPKVVTSRDPGDTKLW